VVLEKKKGGKKDRRRTGAETCRALVGKKGGEKMKLHRVWNGKKEMGGKNEAIAPPLALNPARERE